MAPGCNKSGPSLWGIFGKEAGTVDGYVYTQAMRQSGVVWTEESMFGFLRSPKQYIPGNKMIFQGLARDQDAKDVIAYIKAESDGVKLF
ncbi:cytochrome c [Martensiomyces pterosporus]|nr:cytochrome c [Martensiomyces pterosporus]